MFCVNSNRLYPSLVPKDQYAIKIFHLHNGNDEDGRGRAMYIEGMKPSVIVRKSKYLTVCSIIERATGYEVAWGTARCSSKDTPKRASGHSIALGRALKAFTTLPDGPQTAYNAPGATMPVRAIPHLRVVASPL